MAKVEIFPLKEELNIGTCKMFIENGILRGREMVEAAVIRGDCKETLISLDLLRKLDLVHATFPLHTISDYKNSKTNKKFSVYSSLYKIQQNLFEESRKMKARTRECRKLREERDV